MRSDDTHPDVASTPTTRRTSSSSLSPADRLDIDYAAMVWLPLRPNFLILGPPSVVRVAVATVLGGQPHATHWWSSGARLPAVDDPRPVILHDVSTLSAALQRAWLIWIDDQTRSVRQIISTSQTAVFPLVTRGLFLETLYYRLNTVLLDLRSTRVIERR